MGGFEAVGQVTRRSTWDSVTEDQTCELSPEGKRQRWEELGHSRHHIYAAQSAPTVGLSCQDQAMSVGAQRELSETYVAT